MTTTILVLAALAASSTARAGGIDLAPRRLHLSVPGTTPRFDDPEPEAMGVGRSIATFLLLEVTLPVAGGLAGWAVLGPFYGMRPSGEPSTMVIGATYAAAVAGSLLAMAGVTYWMYTGTESRPSYWASVLGGVIGAAATVGIGLATGDPGTAALLAYALPAIGVMVGAAISRERYDALAEPVPEPPAQRPEPPMEPNPEFDDEDDVAMRRLPAAPRTRELGPRTPVVTVLAVRF